jgi:CheY-like chemotaxis protein
MDVLDMFEMAKTEEISSTASNRNRLMGKLASARDRSTNKARVWTGLRMLRVLVVDEELSSANSLVRLACHEARASLAAPDSCSGVRVASAQHPDVVLLDLDLPHKDGCQVARHLRSDDRSKDCLIVAVTEQVDEACRKRCREAGIDLLLTKPVDPEVVETLLLLECLRVNRIQADNAATGSTGFACQKSSADKRDRAATASHSRPSAVRADNSRKHAHETGGSSC